MSEMSRSDKGNVELTTDELQFTVRTADQTHKAALEIAPEQTGAQVIQAASDNWGLPADTDYALVNISTGKTISPNDALGSSINNGDLLEIQPVLVAGSWVDLG